MTQILDGARRKLVIAAAGVTAVAVAGGYAFTAGPANNRRLRFGSLAAAAAEIAPLSEAKALVSSARWTWAQTLAHCAQSIEYSMSGFPQVKSELFRRTVGAAALTVFSWRGGMTHDLAEPIPGAPGLDGEADAERALHRLRTAIRAFAEWTAPLEPHFAYGLLAKPEYEQAHAMHLANHLSAYRAAPADAIRT